MTDADGRFTLVRAARLIDGNGGPPLERGAILMEGDMIAAVGTEEAVVPPEGAAAVETSDCLPPHDPVCTLTTRQRP